jgi:poly(3-hydroxybutyrate) depolymerase
MDGAPLLRALLAALPLAAYGAKVAPDDAALPRLEIQPGSLTVSGLSSGGYMATQFQVAYSRAIAGAGVIAAGPWFCAEGVLTRALNDCLAGETAGPDDIRLVAIARASGLTGVIDDPSGLADDRVWVLHGARDRTVGAAVTDSLVRFYRAFAPAGRILYETQVPVGHGFPTAGAGVACESTASPSINDCGYDAAGRILGHLYDGLSEPEGPVRGELREFGQLRYLAGGARASLDARGLVFVPADCAAGSPCRLHVAFHGCGQGIATVGRAFAEDAGYNRWAAANRIVVLYPQVAPSRMLPFNPKGCWDWWGYSGANYASRDGLQLRAVRNMVAALGAAVL